MNRETTHTVSRVVVDPSQGTVDAASGLTIRARVLVSPALDLRGQTLLIKDHTGAVIATAELDSFEGGINETGETALKAPAEVGIFMWSVVCPAHATDGIAYDERVEPFTVTVTPHATRIVVWDFPSAVLAGETFRLRVGIRCSQGCRLAGHQVAVFDSTGALAAEGVVGSDPWPGSSALHVAELELAAPLTHGPASWEAKVAAASIRVEALLSEIAHAERSSSFGTTIVPAPEALVRVQVIDHKAHTPLAGASVVMHPYRAVTDDTGWAQMWVTKGHYRLLVSHASYLARGRSVEVSGDVTTTAELDPEPVSDPYDVYY